MARNYITKSARERGYKPYSQRSREARAARKKGESSRTINRISAGLEDYPVGDSQKSPPKRTTTQTVREKIVSERFKGKAVITRRSGPGYQPGVATVYTPTGAQRTKIETRRPSNIGRPSPKKVAVTEDASGNLIQRELFVLSNGAYAEKGKRVLEPTPLTRPAAGTPLGGSPGGSPLIPVSTYIPTPAPAYIDIDTMSEPEKSFYSAMATSQDTSQRQRIEARLLLGQQAKKEYDAMGSFARTKPEYFGRSTDALRVLNVLEGESIKREEKFFSTARSEFSRTNTAFKTLERYESSGIRFNAEDRENFISRQESRYESRILAAQPKALDLSSPALQMQVQSALAQGESGFKGGQWEALNPKTIGAEYARMGTDVGVFVGEIPNADRPRGFGMTESLDTNMRRLRPAPEKEITPWSDQLTAFKFQTKTQPAALTASALLIATPLVAKGTSPLAKTFTSFAYKPRIVAGAGIIEGTELGAVTGTYITRTGTVRAVLKEGLFGRKKTPVNIYVTEAGTESGGFGFTRVYKKGSSDLLVSTRYKYSIDGDFTRRSGSALSPGTKGRRATVTAFESDFVTPKKNIFSSRGDVDYKWTTIDKSTERLTITTRNTDVNRFGRVGFEDTTKGSLKSTEWSGDVTTKGYIDQVIFTKNKFGQSRPTNVYKRSWVEYYEGESGLGRARISDMGRRGQISITRQIPQTTGRGRGKGRSLDFTGEQAGLKPITGLKPGGRSLTWLGTANLLRTPQAQSQGLSGKLIPLSGLESAGRFRSIEGTRYDTRRLVMEDTAAIQSSSLRTKVTPILTSQTGIGGEGGTTPPPPPPPFIPIGGFFSWPGGGSPRSGRPAKRVRAKSLYSQSIVGKVYGIKGKSRLSAMTGIGIRGG